MRRAFALPSCWALLCAAAWHCAQAGSLHVAPTRVELSPERPVSTLEVRNSGPSTVTIQIERMAWLQEGGTDVYTPTQELIATPGIFELTPGATQTLRLAAREWPKNVTERAFRVYVRELPRPAASADAGIQVALRIGVPVFAGKAGEIKHPETLLTADPDGKATLHVRNPGTRYLRVLEAEARAHKGDAILWRTRMPAYVVSGSARSWTEPPLAELRPGQLLDVKVRTESGLFENTVVVSR